MSCVPGGITGVVLTFNGEKWLPRCLKSLSFCDKLLVVDSYSKDSTLDIARAFGAEIYEHEWRGTAVQYKFAFEHVDTEWIATIDEDEIIPTSLKSEILTFLADADKKGINGCYVRRKTWYLDRFMKHSGWYPDYLLRVFRKKSTEIIHSGAHEQFVTSGETAKLKGELLHFTYNSFYDQVRKNNEYAEQGADDMREKGKKYSLINAILHATWRFVRMYFMQMGFLDGRAGFIVASHDAFYTFSKYLRIDRGSWDGTPEILATIDHDLAGYDSSIDKSNNQNGR